MADSFFSSEVFGDDDNADSLSNLIFPSTNENIDFLTFESYDENVNLLTDSNPQTGDVQDGPPAVLQHSAQSPPPSNSANDDRTLPRPSTPDWETHKETIIGFYWDNITKQLPRIMQDRYGFTASAKQYTRRLRRWGIGKNFKGSDMHIIVPIWLRRLGEGKETVFKVRNRHVPRNRIVRFKKRNNITANTNTLKLGPTPKYITYYTPTRSECGSISGGQRRPHGSSSALQEVGAPMAPMAANLIDHHTRNRTTNNTAARNRQSTEYDTYREQLKLSPDDTNDLWILCAPVPDTDLRVSTERMVQILAADRARGINGGSSCRYCGFLSDSPLIWDHRVAAIVASRLPDLDMTTPSLVVFLELTIKHNEDMVLRHLVQRCQQEKFAQRIHCHLFCIALDHCRGDLFRQLLLHGLDVDAEGSASRSLLWQARKTLHNFIIARVEQDDGISSVAEAMGLVYRACVMDEKLWKNRVLWNALRCRRADILRACLEQPTSAVVDIDELMSEAATIRDIITNTSSAQAAAELVVAAAGVVSENGATDLHLATSLLLSDEVLRLLDAGANVNAAMNTGETALHILAGLSSMDGDEVAQILLGRGADLAAADSVGDGALHYAARNQWTHCRARFAHLLVQAGADIHARNHRGETPCITAALYQDLMAAEGAMQWFLTHGALEDALDYDRNTARRYLQKRLLEEHERKIESAALDVFGCGDWDEVPWIAGDQGVTPRVESVQQLVDFYET
ncbi:Ankyrin repeat-containing domain protein [Akanthomyces lecanii RCEF 1005]|uniref:Ankyrin repeat-containing domain protein n=1 Tax=Akanthomyces lecanii RCEF 1005 TaxID=1081108 RepID=A0A168HD35_CORDF|nr:Ankyrin repeat-containing domain protein [Akanthomyces lecanii RCEF 1005]